MKIRRLAALCTAIALSSTPALAHVHSVNLAGKNPNKSSQVIANGQNHPAFVDLDARPGIQQMVSCERFGPGGTPGDPSAPKPPIGPAWYGLETAHHGPDTGQPGKRDGCYALDAGKSPATDVTKVPWK
jgi:hypothetical protein